MRCTLLLIAALALAACSKQPVRVASKEFAENRILAEMFALLIEDAGVPVEREIPYGDTTATFEALRSGAIDVYPGYTGTGLVLLGLAPTADSDAALAEVRSELSKLGVDVLDPLGFEATYAVIVPEQTALDLDLETVEDLAALAPDLRLAVTEVFARRPSDGLQPFLDFYGLQFDATDVLPEAEHTALYDRLIDGEADVVVGFATDPEIVDYQLRGLSTAVASFPAYDAVPLVARTALERRPEIGRALGALAGRIDAERMRALNAQVEQEGRSPREVAVGALVDLGLLEEGDIRRDRPVRIAIDPAEIGDPMANDLLRAARRAVPGRRIAYLGADAPVRAMRERRARVALAPSIAQYEIDDSGAIRNDALETIAALGSYLVHALAPEGGPASLAVARTIATGPVGSPAHKLGLAVASQLEPPPEIVALPDTAIETALDALSAGDAEAVLVLAPLDRPDLTTALAQRGALKLLPAREWWTGATRLAFPFLHAATIPEEAYGAVGRPVPTLAMQATVVGPAPQPSVLGRQGPSTYSEDPHPVTDAVVLALDEELGPHPDIEPHLRPATVLTPQIERAHPVLNRTPGFTVLSLGIMVFLAWAGWLLVRPDVGRRR